MESVLTPPQNAQVIEFTLVQYGITGHVSRLSGENFNYLIVALDGQQYVLKLVSDGLIDLEHQVVERILAAGINLDLPRIIHTRSGHIEVGFPLSEGTSLRARLFETVSGKPWREAGMPGRQQLHDGAHRG